MQLSEFYQGNIEKDRAQRKANAVLTPVTKQNKNEISYSSLGNNSTMLLTSNDRVGYAMTTPVKKREMTRDSYELSVDMGTPVKKSKRREITPASPKEDYEDSSEMTYGDRSSFKLGYSLLKKNSQETDQLNFSFQKETGQIFPKFEKLSKSKFLDRINNANNINESSIGSNEGATHSIAFRESREVVEKLKGAYLLSLLEDNQDIFETIMQDKDLFNRLTNLFCHTTFEGFNNRSEIFFKYLDPNVFLEIVDHPLNSFKDSMEMLNAYIVNLEPDYKNYQIDLCGGDRYVFSVQGACTLKTEDFQQMNFLLSMRICVNKERTECIRRENFSLEQLVTIEYIKIKIFSS